MNTYNVSETVSDSIYKWKCETKNFSSSRVRKSLPQYLHVQFELKVEADKHTKAWMFYTDAVGNVQVFSNSYDHIPSTKYKVVQIWPGLFVCKQVTVCPGHIWTTLYLTHFCHHAPLYSNNICCLIRSTTNYIKHIMQDYCLQQPMRLE